LDVGLGRTAIGMIINSHGRTLYLFKKDRKTVSMWNTVCLNPRCPPSPFAYSVAVALIT
jgi:hypothetical protein